jgi:hypothetical protein
MDQIRRANVLATKFAARLRATSWELIEKRQVEKFLMELDQILHAVRREAKPEK